MKDARTGSRTNTLTLARRKFNPAMRTTLCLVSLTVIGLSASCSRLHLLWHPDDYTDWSPTRRALYAHVEMKYFAHEMDWVARELEEWGTLGISAPVMVRNKGQFAFDPKVTAEDLYAENRTEGAVSLRRSSAVNVALDIDAGKLLDSIIGNSEAMKQTGDPEERASLKNKIVGAMRDLVGSPGGQAALTGLVSGRPELLGLLNSALGVSTDNKGDNSSAKEDEDTDDATASDGDSSPPATRENAAAKAVGEFSKSLGTFDSSKLASINPRRRIRLTASDFWELNLHKFFSMPEKLTGDYVPVFVTFTVSCRPGWRTRSNFAGLVETRVEFMYEDSEGTLKPLLGHVTGDSVFPVAGIYPAYDSQELNLRNSRRELRTFAAQLAASGELAAAKLFLESADKTEQDAETNTGLSTVTGYSSSGQGFGYEFRPTFRALRKPGNRKTKPGFVLEPISFPAVAVALVDMDVLQKYLHDFIRKNDPVSQKRLRELQEKVLRERLGKNITLIEDIVEQAEERVLDGFAAMARAILEKATGTEFRQLSEVEQEKVIDQKVEARRRALTDEQFYALVDEEASKIADRVVDAKILLKQEKERLLRKCHLVFQTSHTWRPLDKPWLTDVPVLELLGRLFQPRLPESDFVKRLTALAVAYEHFDRTFCAGYQYDNGVMMNPLANQYACESLRKRWAMLASQAVNFDASIKLKLEDFEVTKDPTITSVQPSVGWLDAETLVVIHGKNFGKSTKKYGHATLDKWVKDVFVGGMKCTKFDVTSPSTVIATIPANTFSRSDLKHDATVVTWEGTATAPHAIKFVTKAKAKKGPTGTPAVAVTRDAEGRVTAISVNPDAVNEKKDVGLLQAIRKILENENCCEDVEINCVPHPAWSHPPSSGKP